MAEASIPIDLTNPGQVFACLGFLEAADLLRGDAEGGFDWSSEAAVKFDLRSAGEENPFASVLEFLAGAQVKALAPVDWRPKKEPEKEKLEEELSRQENTKEFPGFWPDTSSALPIQTVGRHNNKTRRVVLSHWADGSSRKSFKLYAGNRSALGIAEAMIRGIAQLWKEQRNELVERPFDILTSMSGSFNFDPRGAWTAIDAGYSPNAQGHRIEGSPVVEFLAAWGMENTRPDKLESRRVRYAAWSGALPPPLARVALAGRLEVLTKKRFSFELNLSGKNKIVTFAQEEIAS